MQRSIFARLQAFEDETALIVTQVDVERYFMEALGKPAKSILHDVKIKIEI